MQNKPLVSILIPCFNSLTTIDDTLKSVLAQTYCNIEIIVNDDFSSDGTFEHIKKSYAGKRNLKITQNDFNLGMCGNWNKLFEKATGEYWLKLDADDIINPTFIETTTIAALAHKSDFTGTSYQFYDKQQKQTSNVFTHQHRQTGFIEKPLQDIFINYPFHLCFTLLKADFVKKMSPQYFFMDTEVGDAEFQIRAALNQNFKAYFINEELGLYCFHGNNSSLTPLKQAKSFIYDLVGKHHESLKHNLGKLYQKKIATNFKCYLKDMILQRAPWDLRLLYTSFKYAII
jgi:glycosyltransferase involved in cell wall biosynthesis